MRTTVAALILGAALVAGCGGDDGGGDESTSGVEFDSEGIDFVSPAEGVPLPDGAFTVGSGTSFAMYGVEGSTFDDLDSFYRSTFPDGDDWNDWAWCEQLDESWGSQWTFDRGNELLVVNVNHFDGEEPPAITVGVDEGTDPCPST